MARKKIILQTNGPWIKTGLGEQGRYLLNHLVKTDKYDLVYYCTQIMQNDPNLSRLPVKAYGAIPNDQNIINRMNGDPGFAQQVAYGCHFIDEIIKTEKPDIWWESDDIWSTNGYMDKSWFKQIHSIFHKTVDSRPVLDEAYKQAKDNPLYRVWADFAAKEMRARGSEYSGVKAIYGMFDTTHFEPISPLEKLELRRKFNIDPSTFIFHTTNRNQLRKMFPSTLQAFSLFKKENPDANAKIHFHTSFSEKGAGWDIPKMAKHYGVNKDDVLCTYVCKSCKDWHIRTYIDEDIDCPVCRSQKSCVTPNIGLGVPDDEMKLMHGCSDVGLSVFDSGGQERFSVTSMLCGLPTAISSYACGEDFMNLPFVHPIDWVPYHQPGTNFVKATPKIESIKDFMVKSYRMKKAERQKISEEGRDWALKTFSSDVIGKQWEELFDSLPPKDWSSIVLTAKPKNPGFPMPEMTTPEEWVKSLYNNILLVDPDPDGFKYWVMMVNEKKAPLKQIYDFFIGRALEDNKKNEPVQDFGILFDKNEKKKILFVLKESGGDIFVGTSLFANLKKLYPDADLYVACEPKFMSIIHGNPHIHRVLAYHPAMEQEMSMMHYVDHYYFPAIATQRHLNYLTHDKISLDLTK